MEDIKYKIVEFNRSIGQIIVEFDEWHPMPIDLHVDENGLYPVGDELDVYIKKFYPIGSIERKRLHEAGIANADEIEKLVEASTYTGNKSISDDLFSILK